MLARHRARAVKTCSASKFSASHPFQLTPAPPQVDPASHPLDIHSTSDPLHAIEPRNLSLSFKPAKCRIFDFQFTTSRIRSIHSIFIQHPTHSISYSIRLPLSFILIELHIRLLSPYIRSTWHPVRLTFVCVVELWCREPGLRGMLRQSGLALLFVDSACDCSCQLCGLVLWCFAHLFCAMELLQHGKI